MSAAKESEKFIEAPILGMHACVRAEMPFADNASGVSRLLESLRESFFRDRHASAAAAWVEFMTEAILVSPSEQTGPRGRTIRARDIAVGETRARCYQSIEMRRGNVFATMEANIGIAHVIANDEQNVRLLGFLCTQGDRDPCEQTKQTGCNFHKMGWSN